MIKQTKRLTDVALPLDALNAHTSLSKNAGAPQ